MDDAQIPTLTLVATAFRNAFDSVDLVTAPGNFPHFPKGCCASACVFIAAFLKDRFGVVPDCRYRALHSNGAQHEFLVLNGVIVDITADQFPDCVDRVIVTRHSRWHDRLSGGEQRAAYPLVDHFERFDDSKAAEDTHTVIVSHVNAELEHQSRQSLTPDTVR